MAKDCPKDLIATKYDFTLQIFKLVELFIGDVLPIYCYYKVCRIITIEMKPGNNSNGTHNLTMPETVGPMMWSRKPERNLKYYEQVMLGNLIKGKEIRIK